MSRRPYRYKPTLYYRKVHFERSAIFSFAGDVIYMKDGLDSTPVLNAVLREWHAVSDLWRKERQDCGCAGCRAELALPEPPRTPATVRRFDGIDFG